MCSQRAKRFHGDIDTGLAEYEDNSFDFVILNQSFQQVKKPDIVLGEALRVGTELLWVSPTLPILQPAII